jgi:Ca2+-binding RTX toxin-like protein
VATRIQARTGSSYIDGLISGTKWDGSITFSFPQFAQQYPSNYASGEPSAGFSKLSLQSMEATRAILTGIAENSTYGVTNYGNLASIVSVNIQQTSNNGLNADGVIRSAISNLPKTAYAYYPNDAISGNGGDIWYGTAYAGTKNDLTNPVLGNYAYLTSIHEIGHSLGLKHPHETSLQGVLFPSDRDAIEFTVMSYKSYIGALEDKYVFGQWDAPQTFMMFDIQALQTMYGADYNTNSGNTIYSWSSVTGQMFVNGIGQGIPGGNRVFLTIWDGGGTDIYDLSNYTNNVTIDLAPGGWSVNSEAQRASLGKGNSANGTVYNSLLFGGNTASFIENAFGGSGDDTIWGNFVDNELRGNTGSDLMYGLHGNDTLYGGAGIDIAGFQGTLGQYIIDYVSGTYTVRDTISSADGSGLRDGIDTLIGVERLHFSDQEVWIEDVTGMVQRFYNTLNGVHFFTASNTEANAVRQALPYMQPEGFAFRTASPNAENSSDVFRFYNTKTGFHFYTNSILERAFVKDNLPDYRDEGVAYKAYVKDNGPQEELYRFFNNQTGAHFFTTSEAERDSIITNLPNFRYEGVAFYVDVF